MIDSAKIYVKAGNGGNGCTSFRGKKFTRSRHPDGGNGGKGADVVIRVNKNIGNLEKFRFQHDFRAERGKPGQSNKKQGANARNCIIEVPPGTVVRDLAKNLILRDLTSPAEQVTVATGGSGGRGNTRSKAAAAGAPGEARELSLELKLVADIGLIGYPNAGKSTLLNKISSARAKVASYPFTTTSPLTAVVEFSDFQHPQTLTIVEMPGIVLGAHQGKGLGAKFLRHLERVTILIHLLNLAPESGRDPYSDYLNLNQELKLYDPALLDKPQVLVANKIDLPQAKASLKAFTGKITERVFPVSALSGEGIAEVLQHCRSYF